MFFDTYIWDLWEVYDYFIAMFNDFWSFLFNDERWNWIFYLIFFPVILMFIFDLVFSFILSVRMREFRFVNVLSPRSMTTFKSSLRGHSSSAVSSKSFIERNSRINGDVKNYPRENSLKYVRFAPAPLLKLMYSKVRAGDSVRTRDGSRFTYCGMRMHEGKPYFAYRNKEGLYLSSVKPKSFYKVNMTKFKNSVVKFFKKGDKS